MLKLDGLDQAKLLDTAKINNGVWIHLDSPESDPATGRKLPMYLNGDPSKPQRVLVRSYRCELLKEAENKRQKDGFVRMRVAKKKDRDAVIVDSSLMPDDVRFSYLLAALDNFSAEGGVQVVSQEDAKAIYAMGGLDDIVGQIKEVAHTDDYYMASAETEAGNFTPPTATPTPLKAPEHQAS